MIAFSVCAIMPLQISRFLSSAAGNSALISLTSPITVGGDVRGKRGRRPYVEGIARLGSVFDGCQPHPILQPHCMVLWLQRRPMNPVSCCGNSCPLISGETIFLMSDMSNDRIVVQNLTAAENLYYPVLYHFPGCRVRNTLPIRRISYKGIE